MSVDTGRSWNAELMTEPPLPAMLTLDDAYRAAYCMAVQYVALEREPDEGLVLFLAYLYSDPARWEDWKTAVRRAVASDLATDPLVAFLERGE